MKESTNTNQEWKILRDPFYWDLYRNHGEKYILDAGFFYDTNPRDVLLEDTIKIACTPLFEISGNKPCILLSTGSFSPVHQGHINMLAEAKKAVEEQGWNVCGAYLSPGHDEYVGAKNGSNTFNIHERMERIVEAVKNYDFIKLDPFEGVFCSCAVNFTDIIHRLQLYYKHYCGIEDLTIFYVCSNEYEKFINTFQNRGHCVIIAREERLDGEKFLRDQKYKNLLKAGRLIFANNDPVEISSTMIRNAYDFSIKPEPKKELRLRMHRGENNLQPIFRSYFDTVNIDYIDDQTETFEQWKKNYIVSLDSEIKGHVNFEISRLYDLFGTHKKGYVPRPGAPDFDTQMDKIKKECFVFDDDVFSGETMRHVRDLFATRKIKILGHLCLSYCRTNDMETLDLRDFYISKANAGLVIEIAGSHFRVPYIYPFVNPYHRASVTDPLDFSIMMWQLNKAEFSTKDLLADYPHLIDLFSTLGFTIEQAMHDICDYYINFLNTLK